MPTFQIRVANDEFDLTTEQEQDDFETAKAQAIKGALDIGSEQLLAGKPFFAAEVEIADGNTRQRFIVALGVSALQ